MNQYQDNVNLIQDNPTNLNTHKEAFGHMKILQERIALEVNKENQNLLNSKNSSSRNSSPIRKESMRTESDVNFNPLLSSSKNEQISLTNVNLPEIVEVYKEYIQKRKENPNNTMQTDGYNFNILENAELDNEMLNVHEFESSSTIPEFGTYFQENCLSLQKFTCESVQNEPMVKSRPVISTTSFGNEDIRADYEEYLKSIGGNRANKRKTATEGQTQEDNHKILGEILGTNSSISKLFQSKLSEKKSNARPTQLYNIDEDEQVTKDKEMQSENQDKGDDIPKNVPDKSQGDYEHLESVGKKLKELEQQICLVKLESSTLMSMSLHDMLKKMWKQIDDMRNELNSKMSKMYLQDRKEKKLLRNNIILNYQNISKMFKQCQNYENVRQAEKRKLEEDFTELYHTLDCSKADRKETNVKDLNFTNFMGRHVDFLPVLLMLVMYLVTLVLKY